MAIGKTILKKIAIGVGPFLYIQLSRILFGTGRYVHIDRDKISGVEESAHIGAFWHYSVAYWLHRGRGRYVAMVSGSKDGEYVARILAKLGFIPIRGSRTKGGLAALKSMQSYMENGYSAAIIADGSKGPEFKVQAGVILLSSRTGVPIVPATWSVDRYWRFRSWDRTILPKPFAKHAICYGEPLVVPKKLQSGDIEKYRLELEKHLQDAYKKAWEYFDKEGH